MALRSDEPEAVERTGDIGAAIAETDDGDAVVGDFGDALSQLGVEVGEHFRLAIRGAGQDHRVGVPAILAFAVDLPAVAVPVDGADADAEQRLETVGECFDERAQPAMERPQVAAALVRFAARRRLGTAILGGAEEALDDAARFALELGEAREARGQAEQRAIAGVDAGDHRIGEHLGRLAASTAAHEGVDRLVAGVGSAAAEALPQQRALAAQRQEVATQQRTGSGGKCVQPVAQEEIAMACRRGTGSDQPLGEASVLAERLGGRLAVEEAVGSGLQLEAVVAQRPGCAAGAGGFFEDGDVGVDDALAQAERDG